MPTPEIPFRRNVVQPMECLKAAWNLVKGQYWLFVAMSVVGVLVGSAIPLGILMGPMMCGLYLTFFKVRRGEPIEFSTLFKGFDYFGPGVVATLVHVLPILAIVIPAYIFFYLVLVVSVAAQGNEASAGAMIGVFAVLALFWLVLIVVIIIISIGFTFSYPLIVDRKLQGFDAVRVSFRGAMSNFWRLLGLSLLSGVLGFAGLLLCYFGVFLVIPITYGAVAVAYEQVFGLSDPSELAANLPPPPPTF